MGKDKNQNTELSQMELSYREDCENEQLEREEKLNTIVIGIFQRCHEEGLMINEVEHLSKLFSSMTKSMTMNMKEELGNRTLFNF